ncbi:DUF4174 domain-containing protein [Rhodobacteraceae bacterium LMO-12]|nr:DUF4174 domain-containing protein [Rhodobacteraceae bacterium LMO-JJ12]
MKSVLALVFTALFALPVIAQSTDPSPLESILPEADEAELSQFLWKKRVLVIFADGPDDPHFIEQLRRLETRTEDLAERDVVLLIDTDPSADSALREKLRPRGFMLVLLGKDGAVYLRKPLPWNVREISRSIDKMPMRREELRN